MESSQELKHRPVRDESTMKADNDVNKSAPLEKTHVRVRTSIARRGLLSLAIGIAIPVSLTLANIAVFGWSHNYNTQHKPFWVPTLWALHSACLGAATLMGLSGWLFWADGGFHQNPTAIGIYLGQLALGWAWDPIFFKMGATRLGLVLCCAIVGGLVACSRTFGRVNPIAGNLVKLCLGWAGLVSFVNLYFLLH